MSIFAPGRGLLAGFLILGAIVLPAEHALARGGGVSGGFHGGGTAMGGFRGGAAGGFVGGGMLSQPSTLGAPALRGPSFGGVGGLPQPITSMPPMRSGPGHGGQPTGMAGNGNSSSGRLNSLGAFSGGVANPPLQIIAPPVQANMNPNPALTGGSSPAIGQPIPPLPDVFASSGGAATIDHSGGGGATLASCMDLWDKATHMTRSEWRQTCVRTLNGIDLPVDTGAVATSSGGSQHLTSSTFGGTRSAKKKFKRR